jgi:hypothetical protein
MILVSMPLIASKTMFFGTFPMSSHPTPFLPCFLTTLGSKIYKI